MMQLGFGLNFLDLNNLNGLRNLDQIFLDFLSEHNQLLYKEILLLRSNSTAINDKYYSDFLLRISPLFDDFFAKLFNIEPEIVRLRLQHKEFDVIYECKRKFVQRIAIKKYPQEKVNEIDFANISKSLARLLHVETISETAINHDSTPKMPLDDELGSSSSAKYKCNIKNELAMTILMQRKFAMTVLQWQSEAEKYKTELDIAAQFAAFMVYNNDNNILFVLPEKIDQDNLISLRKLAKYQQNARSGFDYYDPSFNLDEALNEAHYCIYCHKQAKDSCSKGLALPDKLDPNTGCPLKQKISEMNYVKSKGFNLAALAIIIIDNPMVAATGHRICNDCVKACIYQKQDPVNIPLIESNILDTTLNLPYGLEIYLLLTRWNPLNIFAPLPKDYTNYKILVVGLGPAGFSLSYYLLRDGHNVIAIDSLNIIPLAFDINEPIKYWSDYKQKLSEKIPQGFGGVAEYGITPRWDKNNLTILRLILERNIHFKFFAKVRLGSNITLDQAFSVGFDHVSFCTGTGKAKIIEINNLLAKGVYTGADFLMTLQSDGAFLEKSTSNLVIRMPIVIIGGGLTSIDSATEALHYYKLQVEKFYNNYECMIKQYGKDYIQNNWTIEDKLIAQEFIDHATLFRQTQDMHSIKEILNNLGGVTIYYRGYLRDSPAYKLNHEELMCSMGVGVEFVENMIAININVDEHNYVESIEFDHFGIRKKVAARTIILAIGTEESNIMSNHSYNDQNHVSYFGDCNPLFAGSVVKAIASTKAGHKCISKKLVNHPPNFSGNYLKFVAKLDSVLTSHM